MTLLPLWFVLTLGAVVGLCVGSFLNVVVHRVPAGASVWHPPSACPGCSSVIRARDNVPVLSWLALRGSCRDCALPISSRYPLVEAATAVGFVLVCWRLTEPILLAVALLLLAVGLAHSLIDLEHGRLPFAITGVCALGLVTIWGISAILATAPDLATIALASGIWLAVYGGIWFVTAGRGMGLGDVALAPVLGAALGAFGLGSALVGLMAGFVIGAVVSVALVAFGLLERGRVPHGPFMIVGAMAAVFVGKPLSTAYLTFTGLG